MQHSKPLEDIYLFKLFNDLLLSFSSGKSVENKIRKVLETTND